MAVSQLYSTHGRSPAAALDNLRQLDDSILESESIVLDACIQKHHNNCAETVKNAGCWKDICSSRHS